MDGTCSCEEFFPARTLRTTDIAAAHERMLYDEAGDDGDDGDMPAHSLLQAMAYQVARVHAQRPPRLHASSPRKPILQHTMRVPSKPWPCCIMTPLQVQQRRLAHTCHTPQRWMKGCRDAVSSFDSSANKALQEEVRDVRLVSGVAASFLNRASTSATTRLLPITVHSNSKPWGH